MDLLDNPVPFTEAVQHLAAQDLMPTDLGTAGLRALSGSLKRQSVFSAHTLLEYHLQNIQDVVGSIVEPQTIERADRITPENPTGKVTVGMNPATARAALRKGLLDHGYTPNADEAGTIKDLASDGRLDLVIQTNVDMAHGAGQFVQANLNADVLDAYPATELLPYDTSEVPRGERRGPKGAILPDPDNSWEARWTAACDEAGDTDATDAFQSSSRMVALKSSGVWQALGDGAGGYDDTLGNPYYPFAFNSTRVTEEVDRADAEALGLIDPGETAKPADFDLSTLFQKAA